MDKETPSEWTLSVDDSLSIKGSDAGIVLEWPNDILIEKALKFKFKASNN